MVTTVSTATMVTVVTGTHIVVQVADEYPFHVEDARCLVFLRTAPAPLRGGWTVNLPIVVVTAPGVVPMVTSLGIHLFTNYCTFCSHHSNPKPGPKAKTRLQNGR